MKSSSKLGRPAEAPINTHQPSLSKISLAIASTLGDPFERLTSKSRSIRKKAKPSLEESLTFTPKVNTKSAILMQNKKDRNVNRFQELHEQAYYLESKKEKLRIEKELAATAQEAQNCAFKPQLVSNYSPEYLNEMSFVDRSYLWKKRIEQKLENQRKSKEEMDLSDEILHATQPIKSSLTKTEKVVPLPVQPKSIKGTLNIAEELNEFFNMGEGEDLDNRRMLHKYLY